MRSIKDINANADMIQELIQVINNVADQTNILAMNAAIEAAHAGEAGKGFAVVADEIRKLAETTGENARNISSNLNEIIANIKGTASLTEETGRSITEMTGGIEDVADSMKEMTGGLKEITTGTAEVTEALDMMISITEEVRQETHPLPKRSNRTRMTQILRIHADLRQLSMNSLINPRRSAQSALSAFYSVP